MKAVSIFFVLLFFSSLAYSEESEIKAVDIGSGFSIKTISVDGGKSRQLYFGGIKLGQLGNYSISPSGSYAAFQDAPAGNIYIFRVDEKYKEQLSSTFIAPIKQYTWNEKLEILRVDFANDAKSMSFAIE